MKIEVSFVSPKVFTWRALDDSSSTVGAGTGTTVADAGVQAVSAMKTFLVAQSTNFTVLNSNWQ